LNDRVTSSTPDLFDALYQSVGFMQGRMSAVIDGRIQAFPWASWREEFEIAERNGFRLMEWTLDHERLYENPLLTNAGQDSIRELMQQHHIYIPSLTGDCFMQAPFWKAHGEESNLLRRDFLAVAAACGKLNISMLVLPLVDNGRLQSCGQEDSLVAFLQGEEAYFKTLGLRVLFESDFDPPSLCRLINRFDLDSFGINYDTGNSAALGFDPAKEIAAYGQRIMNVHIKDRLLGGTTVPLGAGATNFASVFNALKQVGYASNFILQTARSADDDHVGALRRDMTVAWLRRAEAGRLAS
jgi:L-ribulose-5-phosphate 3-epimerase